MISHSGSRMFNLIRALATGYLPINVFGRSTLRQTKSGSAPVIQRSTSPSAALRSEAVFEPLSFQQFVNLDIPPREMLLRPILNQEGSQTAKSMT